MTLARQAGTNHGKQVVGSNDDDGKQRPRRATATPRLRPEGHSNQSEYQARRWKRQPFVQFHASLTPICVVGTKKLANGSFRIAQLARLRRNKIGRFDWPVALPKGRHGVTVRVFARKLVCTSTLKMKLKLALFGFGNYNRILRQGELRAVLSSGLSEKYAVPLRAAGRHVVDVEDEFGEAFVEDAGLHRKGNL